MQIFGLDLGLEGGRGISKSIDVSGYQGTGLRVQSKAEYTEHSLNGQARLGDGLCSAELLAHTCCL